MLAGIVFDLALSLRVCFVCVLASGLWYLIVLDTKASIVFYYVFYFVWVDDLFCGVLLLSLFGVFVFVCSGLFGL